MTKSRLPKHISEEDEKVGEGPYPTVGYGHTSGTRPLELMNIKRRALGSNDVLIDVIYCGVCSCREQGSSLPLCH